jgi:hypothetical protein
MLGTLAIALAALAGLAAAHITPPVVLVSDRDAVVSLLPGARRYFVREVRLTPEERAAIERSTGWRPEEDFYRFYLGRDAEGRLLAATIFLTEFTIHGPVRVAVALDPQGKVQGATVVELTEETYPWLKPLIDQQFTRDFVGLDSQSRFTARPAGANAMTDFYAQVVGSLVQRAAALYATAMRGRAGAA